jgi:hypothetical protein
MWTEAIVAYFKAISGIYAEGLLVQTTKHRGRVAGLHTNVCVYKVESL